MAQTSLLDTAGKTKEPTRFVVSIERTLNLGNYESMRVGLAESFDVGAIGKDEAYRSVLSKAQAWTSDLKPKTDQNNHETSRA